MMMAGTTYISSSASQPMNGIHSNPATSYKKDRYGSSGSTIGNYSSSRYHDGSSSRNNEMMNGITYDGANGNGNGTDSNSGSSNDGHCNISSNNNSADRHDVKRQKLDERNAVNHIKNNHHASEGHNNNSTNHAPKQLD